MSALQYVDPALSSTPARLLVVQALSVQPLADALEESGYELMRAGDPIAAMDGLAALPQLVLMDMELPDLPGDAPLELLHRLASSGIPVLTLSRRQDVQRLSALVAAGATECLVKPVRMSELLARIERLIQPRVARGPAEPTRPVASMTVRERDGHCSWQSPQARALMADYFPPPWSEHARLPPEVMAWLHREALRRRAGAAPSLLTVAPRSDAQRQRLSFSLMAADGAVIGEGHWLLVLHQADEADAIARLAHGLALPQPDAELLFLLQGKTDTSRVAAALGLGELAFQRRVEGLCHRLGSANLDQALAQARQVLRADH
ncbi:response regulator [Roseateles amylovorans]|uniref:Response regulator n=1 Tax=Roseateles amylovorans TaxID=2978473 RepID=A0ABY6B3I2_9BURK|nr:response regulator [Roseateles amylovorans]UXH79749.1 response regulator [Roseateles amylovorans]